MDKLTKAYTNAQCNKKKKALCKNCNKREELHNAKTSCCPMGIRHGVLGYTQYKETIYEPKRVI